MIQQAPPIGLHIGSGTVHGEHGGLFRRRRADPSPVELEGVRWVCAAIRSQKVFQVADDLTASGFRVFAPHGVKVSYRARAAGWAGDKREKRDRDYPVFGNYIFVGEPAMVFLTKFSHPHIIAVLENGEKSRYVPIKFIENVAKIWVSGRWDERARPNPYRKGDAVRLTDDVFDGLLAVVEKLPNETQAVIKYALLGKEHRQRVDIDRLAMA